MNTKKVKSILMAALAVCMIGVKYPNYTSASYADRAVKADDYMLYSQEHKDGRMCLRPYFNNELGETDTTYEVKDNDSYVYLYLDHMDYRYYTGPLSAETDPYKNGKVYVDVVSYNGQDGYDYAGHFNSPDTARPRQISTGKQYFIVNYVRENYVNSGAYKRGWQCKAALRFTNQHEADFLINGKWSPDSIRETGVYYTYI